MISSHAQLMTRHVLCHIYYNRWNPRVENGFRVCATFVMMVWQESASQIIKYRSVILAMKALQYNT